MHSGWMHDSTASTLLSLGSLARRLDVPMVRLSRLVRAGELVPDFIAGPAKLFRPVRVDELRARLHRNPTAT